MIDAVLEDIIGVAEAPPALADGYAAQADWDPRTATGTCTSCFDLNASRHGGKATNSAVGH
jgi:hypothetical protein